MFHLVVVGTYFELTKYKFTSYFGNSKVVLLHLLRNENIHETKPLMKNPMNK